MLHSENMEKRTGELQETWRIVYIRLHNVMFKYFSTKYKSASIHKKFPYTGAFWNTVLLPYREICVN